LISFSRGSGPPLIYKSLMSSRINFVGKQIIYIVHGYWEQKQAWLGGLEGSASSSRRASEATTLHPPRLPVRCVGKGTALGAILGLPAPEIPKRSKITCTPLRCRYVAAVGCAAGGPCQRNLAPRGFCQRECPRAYTVQGALVHFFLFCSESAFTARR